MVELNRFRLSSNVHFVVARLLFLFAGIIITGFFITNSDRLALGTNEPTGSLMIFFVVMICLNVLIYLVVDYIKKKPGPVRIILLSYFQILFDLVAVSLLIYHLGEPGLFGAFFFLLPIMEAVVLFDFWPAFLAALVAGLTLQGLQFYQLTGSLYFWEIDLLNQIPSEKIMLVVSYGVVYLLAALLFSYNYELVKPLKIIQANKQLVVDNKVQVQNKLNKQKEVEKETALNRVLQSKELELKLAKLQLDKLEQAKSKFISVTTHQLRTPLSAIKWTFNMMIGEQIGPINEEQREFLEKGYESTQRIIGIVNNLLNLDHVNTKDGDLNISDIKVDALVEVIVSEFENQLESKDIQMVIKKPRREIRTVQADSNQIRMVIENLIDNAIKYTPKGGQVTLQIKDDRMNSALDSMEIMVSDTGIGIPEEEQKKIFHKFFRATNAVAGMPDGSGIGLYIAKDIIDRHNGTIWFDSVKDKGTTFHLTLPFRHPEKVTAKVSESSEVSQTKVESDPKNLKEDN